MYMYIDEYYSVDFTFLSKSFQNSILPLVTRMEVVVRLLHLGVSLFPSAIEELLHHETTSNAYKLYILHFYTI